MPAKTKKQQMMMAIAEHTPEKLYKQNRGVLKMSKKQLGEFARTKRKRLPLKKTARKAMKKAAFKGRGSKKSY